MRLIRRSRLDDALVAVREEVATSNAELRRAHELLAAIAETQTRDRSELEHAVVSLLHAIHELTASLGARDRDLQDATRSMLEATGAATAASQDGQRQLVATLERIAFTLEQTDRLRRPPMPGRVLGGTVQPASATASALTPADSSHGRSESDLLLHGVEVRCRFADAGWVGGFEICDVVDDDGLTRYRLRRRSDGSVLPQLFDASLVRAAD